MTTQSKKSSDNSFSSFAVGVSVGVAASLLFGTEEGRNLVKRIVDAIPEKYRQIPVSEHHEDMSIPVIPNQETPHHTTFDYQNTPVFNRVHKGEAPPPPPPAIRPSHPEPFIPQ